jgi:glycine betaine/proline transport system substrate-binding protein
LVEAAKKGTSMISKKISRRGLLAASALLATPRVLRADTLPGANKTVRPLRASWDTFWFGGMILENGLRRLGYSISDPQVLAPAGMYQALAQGDGDFTADVVMPNAKSTIGRFESQIKLVGPIMEPGSLTGYLIDKKTADKYSIRYLTDLRDPAKARLFADGGDRARLIGPSAGWNDEERVAKDVKALGLSDTVEVVQGEYNVLVGDTVARFNSGQPVLLYAWYPNTATVRLEPGKDLVWLEMRADESAFGRQIQTNGGCASGQDPCDIGWNPTTYFVGLNAAWGAANPLATKFLSLMRMPLADRVAQNKLMISGKNKEADLRQQAEAWIAANQADFDGWIHEAMRVGSAGLFSMPQ